jgi:hypothetical protein
MSSEIHGPTSQTLRGGRETTRRDRRSKGGAGVAEEGDKAPPRQRGGCGGSWLEEKRRDWA